ncbi:MAG: MASE3 domain-containing protein [Halanaerobiales bacterium]|nr:MASE3 domain-containing protein [Halanaerobiales bacterium]
MGVFANIDANLPTQLWIIARYMEAISFIIALKYIKTIKNLKMKKILSIYTVLSLVLLLSLYFKVFPDSFIEGSGLTNFKVVSEYVISLILIIALYFLYKRKNNFEKSIYKLIFVSIIMTIFSEISFTFYVDVYGLSNIIGHIFKLTSVLLIFKAVVVSGFKRPFDLIFRQLKDQNKVIKEQNDLLENIYNNIEQGLSLHEIIYDDNNQAVDYRILDVNKAYEKTLDINKNKAVGALASNVYQTDKAPFLDIYAETAASGKVQKFEEYYPPQEKYLYITVTSPKKGQFITLFSDITEIKEKENRLKNKYEEVRKLNRALKSLISIVNRLNIGSKFSTKTFLDDILNIALELVETANYGSISIFQNGSWQVINNYGYTESFVSELNKKRDLLLKIDDNIFDNELNIINNRDLSESLKSDSKTLELNKYINKISDIITESLFFDMNYGENKKIRISLDISSSSKGKKEFDQNDKKIVEAFRNLIYIFINQNTNEKTDQTDIFWKNKK